jgi:hypothetical protein
VPEGREACAAPEMFATPPATDSRFRGLTAHSGLTLTARSDARIAAYSAQRPSTAASTASHGLSQIIPSLLTAIEEEDGSSQDAFQANVCLGWLHYVLEEPGLAVARLPRDFGAAATSLPGKAPLSGWTRVCVVKGAYLKGREGAMSDTCCWD